MCVNETKFGRYKAIRWRRCYSRGLGLQMFSWVVSDKPPLKCQSPRVLHSAINSDKINSLKDGRIIKQRFDSDRLMFCPLKCLQSQSLSLYLSFQMKVSSRSRITPKRGGGTRKNWFSKGVWWRRQMGPNAGH